MKIEITVDTETTKIDVKPELDMMQGYELILACSHIVTKSILLLKSNAKQQMKAMELTKDIQDLGAEIKKKVKK